MIGRNGEGKDEGALHDVTVQVVTYVSPGGLPGR